MKKVSLDLKKGLTRLAQIKGRDELEIDVKAKLDGVVEGETGKLLENTVEEANCSEKKTEV